MPTNLQAATSTTGAVLDPSSGDGTLVIKTGATAGAQVNALSFAADGTGTFLNQPVLPQRLTLMTAQSTAAGNATPIDFNSIPSWVKRITVMFSGVSTNGTSNFQIQIGAGSVTTSGYSSQAVNTQTGTSSTTSGASITSTGFLATNSVTAATSFSGSIKLVSFGSNVWVADGMLCRSDAQTAFSAGSLSLGGTLDRLRLTTVGGADFWDGGSVNVMYEG